MECTDLARLLPAFADGEFEDEDRAEVEVHLAHCDTCRAQVSFQTTFHSFVYARGRQPERAPAALRRRVEQDLAHERLRVQAVRFASYSAVAAGLVLVASAGYVIALPPRQTAQQMVDELVRRSSLELGPDVTAAAGDDGMHSYIQRRVGFHVSVPRFRSADAPPLMGARLVNVRDQDAAEFMYGNDPQRRTTLLVFPETDVELDGNRERIGNRDVMMANHNGYNVAIWKRSGITYSLVSPLDESDVKRLIEQVEDR